MSWLNDDILSTLIPTYFIEENWKTLRVIVSCQKDNWKLPHVNSSLNVWGIPLWQHTIFTEVTDRTLWIIKCSRSGVFLKIQLCKNKTISSRTRILSVLSNVFVWATTRWAMERSWHLHSIYPILAAGRYLTKSWHLSKLTRLNRKTNSSHVWLKTYLRWSHKLPNPKLIFKIAELKHTLMH